MLVTDRGRTRGRDLLETVVQAVQGGVGFVQLREKDLGAEALRAWVLRLRAALPPGTWLAVNGGTDVARSTGSGLHLPAASPTPQDRAGIPWLGRSVHDEREARRAVVEGADYVVVGTIHSTLGKPGRRGGGIALLQRLLPALGAVPVYAIGGIREEHVAELLEAGAHGVTVCGAILEADDPCAAAARLARALAHRGRVI